MKIVGQFYLNINTTALPMHCSRHFFALLSLLAPLAGAEIITGRVVAISDGDTVTVLDSAHKQHRVRMAGIDAPEKAQAYGQVSRHRLSDAVFGRDVTLDCSKVDRYRRNVCVVIVEGQDINLAQVKNGLAWWYRQYASEQTPEQRQAYADAEKAARNTGKGLWAGENPVPPWEWRKSRRKTEGG